MLYVRDPRAGLRGERQQIASLARGKAKYRGVGGGRGKNRRAIQRIYAMPFTCVFCGATLIVSLFVTCSHHISQNVSQHVRNMFVPYVVSWFVPCPYHVRTMFASLIATCSHHMSHHGSQHVRNMFVPYFAAWFAPCPYHVRNMFATCS